MTEKEHANFNNKGIFTVTQLFQTFPTTPPVTRIKRERHTTTD